MLCCDDEQALEAAKVPLAEIEKQLPASSNGRSLKDNAARTVNALFPVTFKIEAHELAYSEIDALLTNGTLHVRSVPGAVVRLLCDPSVAGPNSESLDFGGVNKHELSGCKYRHELQEEMDKDYDARPIPGTRTPVAVHGPPVRTVMVSFYADGVNVYKLKEKSFTPVSVFIGELSLKVRLSGEGSQLIA